MSITPITAQPPQIAPPSFCSRLCQLAESVGQIAIRIFFVAASILTTAIVLPLSFHAIALPIVAVGASLIAYFSQSEPAPLPAPPLVVQTIVNLPPVPAIPQAPRGLVRVGQNCAFNSLVHFLESDPQIAQWLRHPMPQNINMAGFQNFIAGYHPTPRLMEGFAAYAAAQNPQRPIPQMFTDFLTAYVPPAGERAPFLKIQDAYRNINSIHETYSRFLAGYDQAMRENLPEVEGTENLRLAVSRISPSISHSSGEQEDAPEILSQILTVLPDAHKVKGEWARHLNVGELEEFSCFPLSFVEGEQTAQLEQMFHRFCNEERRALRILEAPTALRFQIVRQGYEIDPPSWYNRWFPSWFPVSGRPTKIYTPVVTPDEMTITLASGERKTYRLASFINHGGTADGGHYTAARIVNGQKYFMNDREVTLADPQSWTQDLQQAYLLCYLPVP